MSEVENKTEAEVTEQVVKETTEKETAAKDTKKKASKDRKPGLGTKIKNFFKNNKSELKKVSWYGKKQTFRSSGVVIVALLAVSVAVGLLDLGLNKFIMWIATLV